ncbi:U11/U12 small nuclear ribonucleoprotein 25 kDa protein isoform X2 [Cephus cinctus]|nr:U11/U12 small nuclear ribonucleoprotein 25 kDa protein isoform X2 [Cephus cinctus]XP_015609473.1 U11/U12 small nuclear ribonucleoprotein 25 kDa protein isoform X2 [Cephus cinctus]XP_015609474.1 U11/U12 small nuclear ribonucleoprotein 25 kDa protein isoform X2 [Cephus cinctus]XP_015609475.1 U11/U12 small nuclear ribonucleoprotein 25 kDa protein isoform X2 [Cephus cinctus]XP_015609476.1 U11/U12 small nuclear ribonucleoprotein 25 kDa protein isoform X2 [Cephus cinctus]XP_015609477.1 U11/U12 sm
MNEANEAQQRLGSNDEKLDMENVEFSHEELVKLTKEAIDKIIESDPLLCGLPRDVTVEEIKAQTAVTQGQAITLYLNRGELPKLAIVVPPHNTTVLDLKKAIKRHTNLALRREHVKKKISWKHIWKKYHICFQDVKLTNDSENIKAYGLSNKMELHYVKRHREKNKIQ